MKPYHNFIITLAGTLLLAVPYAVAAPGTSGTNTATGVGALAANVGGSNNTADGYFSLTSNTMGGANTATGAFALQNNIRGGGNTATGAFALQNNTRGGGNTATGVGALRSNTMGSSNTAYGESALELNMFGKENTATGVFALRMLRKGSRNTATGGGALQNHQTGSFNTATGNGALFSNVSGIKNTAIGSSVLFNNKNGSNNTALGFGAGLNNIGNGNVFLGMFAGFPERGSNTLYISNNRRTPLIYGQFSTIPARNKLGIGTNKVPAGDVIKVWNGAHLTKGGVWANASSRALKKNIHNLKASEAELVLDKLSPVRYRYKNSPKEEYLGFIAEDVPDLVAMQDRKSLAAMDIVAVLTRVLKEQKAQLSALRSEKDAEIVALKDELISVKTANAKRMDLLEDKLEMLVRATAGGSVAIAERNTFQR